MRIVTALACAMFAASPALATPYSFTALPDGFQATALNNAGQIAGLNLVPAGGYLAPAVLMAGAIAFPVTPQSGGSATALLGINDAGDLLGSTNNGRSPFLLSGGVLVPFAAPGNTSSGVQVYGLNNARQIVGSASVFDGSTTGTVGFVSSGSSYALVGAASLPSLVPRAINNAGSIVGGTGSMYGGPAQQGFLLQNGGLTTFLVPGSSMTVALAVNDSGEIAGQYSVAGQGSRGFTLLGGAFSDITGAGGDSFLPVGLNDAGQLIGTFASGGPSYLATPQQPTPVPEPASAGLLGSLLAMMGAMHWMRHGRR